MRKCEEAPPGQLLLAIRQFNAREWHESHETLEDLWVGEVGEMRNFLQGTIQIAIALYHWRNGNYGGAVSLLAGGVGYLKRVSDVCLWVDVVRLINDADRMRVALEELGAGRIEQLDDALIPRLLTVSGA